MTTRAPCAIGTVETRMSTSLPARRMRMRPSCGRRFSAIFSPAMIFTRENDHRLEALRRL